MQAEKSPEALLEKIKDNEKTYNWIEATKLYEQLIAFFLERNMVKEAAEAYKKLGYIGIRAAETSDNQEKYIEFSNYAITAYREAVKLFKQMGKNADVSECEAELLLISGIISGSYPEARKVWNKAIELFNISYESFSNENDQASCARTLIRAAMTLYFFVFVFTDYEEILQIFQEGELLAKKAWKISKDIGNINYLAKSLYTEVQIKNYEAFFRNININENSKDNFEELGLRCKKVLKQSENCSDFRVRAMIIIRLVHGMG